MALNMPEQPGQKALNALQNLKETERWVSTHKQEIRQVYMRVSGSKVSDATLERMARSDPRAIEKLTKMYRADAYRQVYESYFGEKKPYKFKTGADRNNESKALAFYGNLSRKYDTPEEFGAYIDARSTVDDFMSTGAGRRAAKVYGYNNLVKANMVQGGEHLLGQAKYLAGINPLFKQYHGREATRNDVIRLTKRHATPADYKKYLGYGVDAANIVTDIGLEGLEGFGAGGITADALQEELSKAQGKGGDLQTRIIEARIRRENAFTAGKSQAYGSKTKGGQFKQDLF